MFDIEKARARGLTEEQIRTMERINENNRKEESCTGHNFERAGFPGKYRCVNCGCEEGAAFVNGYNRGYEHGRGQQNGIERR